MDEENEQYFDEVDNYNCWECHENGNIPKGAFCAGDNCYVIRASHDGQTLIGSLIKGDPCAYVAYNGSVIRKFKYQVFVETTIPNLTKMEWVKNTGLNLPIGAFQVGSEFGFIGRTSVYNQMLVGYFKANVKTVHVPCKGKEYVTDKCDILCKVCEEKNTFQIKMKKKKISICQKSLLCFGHIRVHKKKKRKKNKRK